MENDWGDNLGTIGTRETDRETIREIVKELQAQRQMRNS